MPALTPQLQGPGREVGGGFGGRWIGRRGGGGATIENQCRGRV